MQTFIAFLRGINIGGHKSIKMADLRTYLSELGFKDIQTYIQSGNIIFNSQMSEKDIENAIEKNIKEKYNYDVKCMVLSSSNYRNLVCNNPLLESNEDDFTKLHVCFLEKKPESDLLKKLKEIDLSNDKFFYQDKCIYLHTPDGYRLSKINNNIIERKLKLQSTARNWKTVLKMLELISVNEF